MTLKRSIPGGRMEIRTSIVPLPESGSFRLVFGPCPMLISSEKYRRRSFCLPICWKQPVQNCGPFWISRSLEFRVTRSHSNYPGTPVHRQVLPYPAAADVAGGQTGAADHLEQVDPGLTPYDQLGPPRPAFGTWIVTIVYWVQVGKPTPSVRGTQSKFQNGARMSGDSVRAEGRDLYDPSPGGRVQRGPS